MDGKEEGGRDGGGRGQGRRKKKLEGRDEVWLSNLKLPL